MRQVINSFKLSIFSVLLTTILTFTIFSSISSAKEKNINSYMIAKNESVIRFDGIYQAVRESGNMYLRFYHNGKACSIYTNYAPKAAVEHFLKENYQRYGLSRCGNYLIEGSKIRISSGRLDFWGDIRKDSLVLKVDDSQYNYKATKEYWFIAGPEYAEQPELLPKKPKKEIAKKSPKATTKGIAKKANEQIFKGEFVTETIKYDQYGLYNDILLKNKKGELVAKKIIFRSPYNPTQITDEIIRDVTADKDIHYTKVD